MHPVLIVLGQPSGQVGLLLCQRGRKLLVKRNPGELTEHGLMPACDSPLGLPTLALRPRMIKVVHGSIPLLLLRVGTPAGLRAPSGQASAPGHFVGSTEGDPLVLEQLRRRQGGLTVVELGKGPLRVGSNAGLRGDPAYAFERPDVARRLRPPLTWTFARK